MVSSLVQWVLIYYNPYLDAQVFPYLNNGSHLKLTSVSLLYVSFQTLLPYILTQQNIVGSCHIFLVPAIPSRSHGSIWGKRVYRNQEVGLDVLTAIEFRCFWFFLVDEAGNIRVYITHTKVTYVHTYTYL